MTILSGSPVIAIWTPKRVFLASCGDIHAAGGVHFAMAGFTGFGTFDGVKIAAAALEAESAFAKGVAAAVEALTDPLTQAAQTILDTQPETFKKFFAGRDALDILLIAKNHGEMALSHVSFKTKRRGKNIVFDAQQKDYPNRGTNMSSIEVITAGVSSAVADDFRRGTNSQETLVYPERAVKKFMDLAIAAAPGQAAYPVSIVKMTDAGAEYSKIDPSG